MTIVEWVRIPLTAAEDALACLEGAAGDPREPERYRERYQRSAEQLREAIRMRETYGEQP